MKTLLLLVLLPTLALAQAPADAPLADLPGTSVSLTTDQPAPFPGRLLSGEEQVRRGKVNEREHAELAELKKPENLTLTKVQFGAIVGGSAVVAAIITTVVILFVAPAAKPKPGG